MKLFWDLGELVAINKHGKRVGVIDPACHVLILKQPGTGIAPAYLAYPGQTPSYMVPQKERLAFALALGRALGHEVPES